MEGRGVGPGGPQVSSAKKRRLALLDQRSAPATKKHEAVAATSNAKTRQTRSDSNNDINKQEKRPSRPPSTASLATSTDATPQIENPASSFAYAPLHPSVLKGPAAGPLGLIHTSPSSISTVLEELMATNPRSSDARTIVGGKLRDKTLLLDNPTLVKHQGRRGGGGVNLSSALLPRKQQKEKGLYDLKNANLTYEMLLPLHQKWQEYIQDIILPAQSLKELQERLYNADLHGAHLRVAACLQPRFVGTTGIIARDSQRAFHVVTPDDRFMVIPKKGSEFEYRLDARRVVCLSGDGLAMNNMKNETAGKGNRKVR